MDRGTESLFFFSQPRRISNCFSHMAIVERKADSFYMKMNIKMKVKVEITKSRFATLNPLTVLDNEDEPRDQQNPQLHSFFTSLPGELRNKIYASLLDVPKASEIFAQELVLNTYQQPSLRTALLTEHRHVRYLFHLGLSCKQGWAEIYPLLSPGISNSLTALQVRLDIGILADDYFFCLMGALRTLDENNWLERVLNQTIRIIWPEDNIELFYFGAYCFLDGLPAPRKLQMEIKRRPWSSFRNGISLETEYCDFVVSRHCSLLHRSGGVIR